MGKTLAYKILEDHLLEGELRPGEEITIKMDQTLTQDSTGTMVYLQLEAMDVEQVKTELSVAYIDDTACISRNPETASATSSTSRAMVSPARLSSEVTRTHRQAAASA